MCFGTRGERSNFFVPHMNPLDPAMTADRVGQAVEAIANDAIHPFHTCCHQHFDELFRHGS
jgi:hypothetical protein